MISCGNLCQLHVRHNFRTSETGKIARFLLVNQFLSGLISSHLFWKMLIYNFYRDLFLFINHNTSKKKKHNLRLSIFFSFCKSSLSSKQTWALSERSNPVVSICVFFPRETAATYHFHYWFYNVESELMSRDTLKYVLRGQGRLTAGKNLGKINSLEPCECWNINTTLTPRDRYL